MANYHTTPDGNGNWQVKKEGAKRASAHFDTQKEAMSYGKEAAKKGEGEHFIHGKDGKIRERDSYGNDPFPPRG
ncbi:DUF2188 domain-containing protein [Terribacillus sp. DMT04]|uniref:DUF2188 domain-containing protein n=1 Tax=Terribacillus sp. DMT04 TaxID=2850441 RepID=UPI001C2BF51A|nr:DUF2188 domain-containing protein [Terribacillus sp. DMT04]QXE03186.1 DUF2188 domain-containing protein [Terribacillus sp. DMT04]